MAPDGLVNFGMVLNSMIGYMKYSPTAWRQPLNIALTCLDIIWYGFEYKDQQLVCLNIFGLKPIIQ